ncbi:putative MATE family efflux protein [Hydrogenophaga palleronii]|uniref:MATE family efflux protein n=1 Tax=Hydrogenophaga palleronii TaxID=65655 RepID=A0ABU1WHQ6_9BURK|nr:MATE family efflux transporter [Hydrogenophaga palleronii]MDR7148800.1 putative MATE family efflux protein [Hydrogenophaga palleronii]
MTSASSPPHPVTSGKFVTGSTLGHVITMTATGSIGLAAVFFVDVLNLFYISLLGQKELAAAVGYAGTLLFFLTSLAIGLSIAATALTSRALGRGDRPHAQQLAGASMLLMALFMTAAVVLTFPFLRYLLGALGASGETAELALRFTRIVLPSAIPLGLGMCLGALLRSLGDARRAMFVTLGAGAISAVLDPILIFALGWGLDGAAVATVLTRLAMVGIGLHALLRVHRLLVWPAMPVLHNTLRPFLAIGVPAVLTQVATPVGNAFVTAAIADFGDSAVAGWAVIVRLIPVAFVALFALSGSVGPILGQNLGARRHDRLRATVRDSLKVVLVYVTVVWVLLAMASGWIADAFGAAGEARELIVFFCVFVAGSFMFNGALFVANAAFNNLGFAFYSTALNWGRATLGVVPFIWLGAQWFGARGVMAGYGLGVVMFGLAGALLCRKVLKRIEREASTDDALKT